MGLSDSKISKYLRTLPIVTDSSTKTKSKYITSDFSDMERNNIYEGTPPKVKSNTMVSILPQRRPPVPIRSDSTRSIGRSTDSGVITQMKNGISKSSYNNDTSMFNKNFIPLQSVKEDEFLENEKSSKNDYEQQRLLIDILKKKYPTPIMPRIQRLSSTDDDNLSTENLNGFNRNHRIRSSLPFIVKPAIKSNSLGLCFLICGNETKKVLLPPNISCLDTLKALFVRAFPDHLTMQQMDTDYIRIYIREIDKDIFYQLEDISDVKDRSVLKIVQLNNKPHVSFKDQDDLIYQRLSRAPLTNKSLEHAVRSLSEPRRETTPTQPSTILKSILSSPRSGSTTPRIDEDDSRTKMVLMEKQLDSLTELVKELTKSKPNKSLHQQFYELKIQTHTLRNDLISIRQMQQSLQENFQIELQQTNKNIQNRLLRLNQNEFDTYLKSRRKIDQDLENLEISVEELQNDVKTKQCYITINDVESFALVLSTISRSLVDLKASFPLLNEKFSLSDQFSIQKFLSEEPECLDFIIKKCKRLTTMLYQLKRVSINQENKPTKKISILINEKLIDRKRLLAEIHSIALNSDERMKAIEKAEKLRERRLYYENQLENLKQMKTNSDHIGDGSFDTRSLTNSLSTRTSVCSTDSNNCPSPSLSFLTRQTCLNNDCKSRLKPPSKVTFSQQLITNEKSSSSTKKSKTNPPPRIQNTPSSSSAVSSASSSSSSCTGNGGAARFCGIIPLLSVDRRHNSRCYSFSSSSTDTDSVISNSHKSPPTTLMRASVTDL